MSQAMWSQKGESLSHKNACVEFGLTESEVIDAIKIGKLQYKINYAHGNPYYKLLRREVVSLTVELRGKSYLERQQLEHELKKLTREINSCKRKISACEKEKVLLLDRLTQLEK